MDATPSERWLPVVGWEGLYEVSDQGRVRSVARVVNGRWGPTRRRGQLLSPYTGGSAVYPRVQLCRDGIVEQHSVHQLVAKAFIGPRPAGLETRHWNDIKAENYLGNLLYGSCSDNMHDRVRNGIHNMARKTECKYGHEFTPENTYIQPSTGARRCRTCKRERG